MKTKLKIKRSIKRRFQLTGSGKLKAGRSFNRHLRRNKRKAQLRRLAKNQIISGKIGKKIKMLLGAA